MKGITSSFLTAITLCSSVYSVDISNLSHCVDDIKQAVAKEQTVQLFSSNYAKLLSDLHSASIRNSFPPIYQQQVFDPFLNYMTQLGASGFNSIFSSSFGNPEAEFLQAIIPDICEAILQNGTHFIAPSTNAFQEVVNDLYDGFLSQESRVSNETGQPIKPPDLGVLPPLVKWGNPDAGPYTWPADATGELHIHSAIVSLPPAHLNRGLLGWSALPHETCGHDILHADNGLIDELADVVYKGVLAGTRDSFLANYWKQCIDETASDVLGLLNTGPTTGIGLVGYFRGLMGGPLRNVGAMPPLDTHPVDILRAFLAAHVVSQLSFAGAKEWSEAIKSEAQKDLKTIYLVDARKRYTRLSTDKAIHSAEIVGDVIINTKLKSLENHSLKEIQDWTDADQKIVDTLAAELRAGSTLTSEFKTNDFYAAHVVAAAVQEALKAGSNIQTLFDRMIGYLDVMHQYNTLWNPAAPPAAAPCTCNCKCDCCVKCQQQAAASAKPVANIIPKRLAHKEIHLLNEEADLALQEDLLVLQ